MTAYIDCSNETCEPRETGDGRMRWLAQDIEREFNGLQVRAKA